MSINSDKELKETVEQVDGLIQQIHDYCEETGNTHKAFPPSRIRFPRGFIRPASAQRARLSFLSDSTLKKNLSYTLILSDTILWLILRTDLWGIPKEMLIKLNIFLIGSMCESITKSYLKGKCGKNYEKRAQYLEDAGIITKSLKDDIVWVWNVRNRMHLFQLDGPEFENDYNMDTHRRAIKSFRGLLKTLNDV